jgi:hypothetical protein
MTTPAVVVLIALALALTHFRFHLANLRSAYMLIPIISLLIVAVYRVVQTYTFNPSAPVRGLAAFWILQIFFELCVHQPVTFRRARAYTLHVCTG